MRFEMGIQAFEDRPPLTDRVNAYDEQHLVRCFSQFEEASSSPDSRFLIR